MISIDINGAVTLSLMITMIVVAICSPVNPMVLILSKKMNTMELIKMNTMELIKRVAAPIWCGVLAAIIFGTLVLV